MKNGKEASARRSFRRLAPIIKKDGGEMLVAMVLDGSVAEVPSLVCNSPKLIEEIMPTTDYWHCHYI
jgi:hypothetical protein